MKRWISVLLGSTLLTQVAFADRPTRPNMRPNVPPYALSTDIWEFPSGLRVILQQDRSHPVVSVFTIVDHGFQDDPEGKEELAHFVEHAWFRSVHGDWPPIMDVITGHTSLFNATTRNDWTDYRTTMSSFYLEKLIAMEAYRLSEPYVGITKEQVDVEREVIRNEFRRRNEQDSAQLFDAINKYVYPADHPYHRSSSHESLTNIQLEDIQWYFDEFYKPAETTITIVGDFDPMEVQHYIFKHFQPEHLHPDLTDEHQFFFPRPGIEEPDQGNEDHWYVGYWDPSAVGEKLLDVSPKGRPPRIGAAERLPVPPLGSNELGREKLPVDVTTAMVAWSLPGAYHEDHWELMLLGSLATQAVNQGLRSIYREKEYGDRLGTGTGCGTLPGVLHSTLLCMIEVKDSKLRPEQVAEKAIDQFATLWNPDYVVAFNRQFERARNEFVRDVLLSLDNVASVFGGRAEDIGTHAHYTGRPTYHSEAMEQIYNIDGQVVARLGYEHLTRRRAARMIAEPLDAKDRDIRNTSSSYAGASEEDSLVEHTGEIVPDEIIAELYTTVDMSKLVDTTLDNGLRVVIMPHGEAPVVQASMVFGGGRSEQPKGIYDFVSRFTESSGQDPLEIAGATNYPFQPGIAGMFSPSAYPMNVDAVWSDGWRIEFKAPSGNLDGALWKLRGELESIRPNLSNKTYWYRNAEDSMKRRWTSPGYHRSVIWNSHLFPDSPADTPTSYEDLQQWKRWGASQVNQYLQRHIQPSNAALIIVGNIDPDEALKVARNQFGNWSAKSGVETGWVRMQDTPAMPTEAKRILIFDDEKRTQTDVTMGCRLQYEGEHQDPAVEVLSSILGDETFKTIRVKEGLAYSPGAFAYSRADGAALLQFSSLTVNRGVGRVVEFMHQAVERVANGEADEAEVNSHKLKLANAGGVDAQSVDQVTGHLSWPVRTGKDWSVLSDAGKNIAAVSPDTLDDLVAGCLDHALFVLNGPKDVITPQLDELGYTYEIVDWEAAGEELLWKYDPKMAKKREKAKKKEEAKADSKDSSTEGDGEEG